MARNEAKFASLRVVRSTETLRSQVVDTLRSAIIDGTFQPAERLVERKVCDLLGVSRTLVREALRQLESEGLVETPPYQGPSVAVLTADQVREIYEMRGALEGLAAKLFVDRASAGEVAGLAAAVQTIADTYRRGNTAAQRKAIEVFYDLLLGGAQNKMLSAAITAHRARLSWLRAISLSRRDRGLASLQEKRRIVRAIRARDGAQARALSEEHVANALAAVLAVIEADRTGTITETGSAQRLLAG